MNTPLVSVILPAFNAEAFIGDSIRSIINQTYSHMELIIVDDASTDKTLSIIKTFKARYPSLIRIIQIKKNMNKGGDTCANMAIQLARGKYIARMDADDIALPERIEKQVNFLETNKSVFIVGTSAQVINKEGEVVGEKVMPQKHTDIYGEYMVFHPMIHPTVMFRNHIIKRKTFYKSTFSANNDYFTFFELISRGCEFANIPEKLLKYRIYGNNNSLKTIKKNFFNTLNARIHIFKKYGYPITPKIVLVNLAQLATIVLLPERAIYYIYLLTRGILKIEDILHAIKSNLKAIRVKYSSFILR